MGLRQAPALALLLGLVLAALGGPRAAHAAEAIQNCTPGKSFEFICGLSNPEDIIVLPSTSWLIVSGHKKNGGLTAIDARDGRLVRLASPLLARADRRTYPASCPAPSASEALFTHGLYARATGKARYKLYVVGHEPEAVHVFDVKVGSTGPRLTWIGCVEAPIGPATNSIAALRDGTMLMTIFTFEGLSMGDMEVGKDTGAVLRWRPGDKAFAELPGTRLPGNNGIEISDDEKTMYVVSSGLRAVVAYSLSDQPQRLWNAATPLVKPDNIHAEPGGTFMIGGMVDDEKACGGKRKLLPNGQLEITNCVRGSVAVRLHPSAREAKVVAHVEPDPNFSGTASAAVAGERVWFGAFNGDRIASISLSRREP